MTITRRAFLAAGGTVAASTLLARAAGAQSFPFRPNHAILIPRCRLSIWGSSGALQSEPTDVGDRKVFHLKGKPEDLDGVMVSSPAGKPLAHIRLLERCANLTIGVQKNNRLYTASRHSVYALYVERFTSESHSLLTSQYFMFCRQSDGLTRPLWRISGVRTFTFRRSQTTNSRF